MAMPSGYPGCGTRANRSIVVSREGATGAGCSATAGGAGAEEIGGATAGAGVTVTVGAAAGTGGAGAGVAGSALMGAGLARLARCRVTGGGPVPAGAQGA